MIYALLIILLVIVGIVAIYIKTSNKTIRLEISNEAYKKRDNIETEAKAKWNDITNRRKSVRKWMRENVPSDKISST